MIKQISEYPTTYIFISCLSILLLPLFTKKNRDEYKGDLILFKHYIRQKWLYLGTQKSPHLQSVKWTFCTVVAALSPFIISLFVLHFYSFEAVTSLNDNSQLHIKYFVSIITEGTLAYASIAISSSAYFDYLYCEDEVKALMRMKFKRNCNVLFFVLLSFVLIIYTPLQLVSRLMDNYILYLTLACVGISLFYAYVVKRTIFEAEFSFVKSLLNP